MRTVEMRRNQQVPVLVATQFLTFVAAALNTPFRSNWLTTAKMIPARIATRIAYSDADAPSEERKKHEIRRVRPCTISPGRNPKTARMTLSHE